MKDLTTSIYTFENLIQGNFLYIDKTEYVWQLIRPVRGLYFLSRPRRFGKSLLLSTLKSIFLGKKDLFQGFALYDKPYDWKKYPVIHLDMGNCDAYTQSALREYLALLLESQARQHNVELVVRRSQLASSFAELIEKIAGEGQAVILVDEYDKPILSNVGDLKKCKGLLPILKGFYSTIKKCEGKLRFCLITGVSKFSHVSLFSELNNLTDITLNPDYAGLLGFTEAEIRNYFADRLTEAVRANGLTEEQLMKNLLEWYDGYRFSEADTHVCNPVSVTQFFYNNYRFSNYWDSTGTPSFLLEQMQKQTYDHETALNGWYGEGIFSAYELERLDITGLLWQTGYLTIRDVRRGLTGIRYRLGFPDREVRQTFMSRLLEFYGGLPKGLEGSIIDDFCNALLADDLSGLMNTFQSFLARIHYGLHIPQEKYYQTIFFIVFELIGVFIEAESQTNQGRIDAYIRTAKTIYIFEFKLNKSAGKAIGQILDRRYYEKFQSSGLPIRLIGVNFDSAKGRINNWEEMG